MSLKHLFKREFLTSQEREDLRDLPYDDASLKFCHILARFFDQNQIKISRELTTLETIVGANMLFEIFLAVKVYDSDKFWNVEIMKAFVEQILTLDLTELRGFLAERGLKL